VDIANDACHGGRRNGRISAGQTRDYLLDDRLLAQLDHTRSLTSVHHPVNLGSGRLLAEVDEITTPPCISRLLPIRRVA
jgi:hypothetical protein